MDKKNTFRVNTVITYSGHLNVNNFQIPMHSIFQQLAWLHRLEYAIVDGHHVFDIAEPTNDSSEIIYLRSTGLTRISAKDLKRSILNMFKDSIPASEGIDVFFQMHKYLPKFPFPSDYTTPLNYPYVEINKGGQKSLFIYKEVLQPKARLDLN